MDWKLCYVDGSTFSAEDGGWREAPARGVLALLYPDATGRTGHRVDTGEVYVWPPWRTYPVAMDAWGLMDYLLDEGVIEPDDRVTDLPFAALRAAGVKLGRVVDDDTWREVWERACSDPDFTPKSTATADERTPW